MKHLNKTLAVIMIGGLSLGGQALAERDGGSPHHGMKGAGHHHKMYDGMGGGKHGGGEAMGKRMIEKLDLTEEQLAQSKALRQQALKEGAPLREKVREAMKAERKALASDASERELKKLARKTADARVDMMLQVKANKAKFREILTPEQTAQLDALEATRKAHREERMKKRQEKMDEK